MDLASIDDLRRQAKEDPNASLKQVALQFEGIFLGMMLKEMRSANAVFETDSPFNSQTSKFYQDMQDKQMVTELSEAGSLGLADLIVAQLGGDEQLTPASALRGPIGADAHGVLTPESAASKAMSVANASAETNISQNHADLPKPPLAAAINPEPDYHEPRQFIQSLLPHAQKASSQLGVSPQVLIAQSALETGWGRKVLSSEQGSSNNLFNIKAGSEWQGETLAIDALEVEQGVPVKRRSEFRIYEDIAQSFNDYVDFVQKPRYQDALDAGSDEGFIRGLQQGGYATDPNYADKVMGIMKRMISDSELWSGGDR
ncbi:flagellar assembly peptidoglycan hydrolase FlgJ [Ferrimonas aestuarii]|uniref:Peptidoglycan hydrolase FlgJ n=2 Tax=Ferrimonas aestuarii TaxID=2569539 RepID=A0A4U1BSN5_9GAMM|nr:flagellar assembly peptidoglycan hydrolase FlgJ [Ferrimonas aestuarii]